MIGVARKLGVHRRMVREAVRNAVPAQRKKTERPALKMPEHGEREFVNVVATVYARDGRKLFETMHQGNWRWSKPDKDCLEDALNYLLAKP